MFAYNLTLNLLMSKCIYIVTIHKLCCGYTDYMQIYDSYCVVEDKTTCLKPSEEEIFLMFQCTFGYTQKMQLNNTFCLLLDKTTCLVHSKVNETITSMNTSCCDCTHQMKLYNRFCGRRSNNIFETSKGEKVHCYNPYFILWLHS